MALAGSHRWYKNSQIPALATVRGKIWLINFGWSHINVQDDWNAPVRRKREICLNYLKHTSKNQNRTETGELLMVNFLSGY
jgi:hypothetical protein